MYLNRKQQQFDADFDWRLTVLFSFNKRYSKLLGKAISCLLVLFLFAGLLPFENMPASAEAHSFMSSSSAEISSETRDFAATEQKFEQEYVPGEVIVRFKNNVNFASQIRALENNYRNLNLDIAERLPFDTVLLHTSDTEAAVTALNDNPGVEFAQPNFIYQLRDSTIPDDPFWNCQWGMHSPPQHLHGVQAVEAWEHTKGSDEIIVAVIDSGIDYHHEDLSENMWVNLGEIPGNDLDDDNNGFIDDVHGYDFFDMDPSPTDDDGHGTHVAGIIAAGKNNSVGIAGAAPEVSLMAVDIFSQFGGTTTDVIVEAINYAADNGAQIVNMSFGGPVFDPAMYEAIAAHPDVLFVAAAGNDRFNIDVTEDSPAGFTIDWHIDHDVDPATPNVLFPALPHIMSVAALSPVNGVLAGFSNYGVRAVDLAAPGEFILSTLPQFNPGAAIAVDNDTYQTMFWGFGAEDLANADDVSDSLIRVVDNFFDLTPSSTIAAQGGKPILLVDDDQSEEGLLDVSAIYTQALTDAGYEFDKIIVESSADAPTSTIANATSTHSAIIWFTGESNFSCQLEFIPNLTASDQKSLSDYLDDGGKLFLSGRDAGFDITDTDFYRHYLKAEFQAEKHSLPGVTGNTFPFDDVTYDFLENKIWLDLLSPLEGAVQVLKYAGYIPYTIKDGTSMAAPFAAAGAALLLSLSPTLGPETVIALLNDNVTSLPELSTKVASGGTLNIAASLEALYLQKYILEAEAAVNAAEAVLLTTHEKVQKARELHDLALTLVNALPAGAGKDDLLARLGVVLSAIESFVETKDVSLTPAQATVPVGLTIRFTASLTPANATNKDIKWFSDNHEIATVDNTGLASGLKPGTANISVKTIDGGFTATSTLTVVLPPTTPPSTPAPTPPETATPTPAPVPAPTPTPVPATVEAQITSNAPTTIELPDTLHIEVPANAIVGEAPRVSAQILPEEQALPLLTEATEADLVPASGIVMLSLTGGEFRSPVQMSLHFDREKIPQGKIASVFVYNERTDRWVYLGGDVKDNVITFSVNRFSKFAVFAIDPVPALQDTQRHWARSYIATLAGMRIIGGFPDGNFRPDSQVTRAEFVSMLVRAIGLEAKPDAAARFTDSSYFGWAAGAIGAASEAELIGGYADGTFAPNRHISRAEVAVIIDRAIRKRLVPVIWTIRGDFEDMKDIPGWAAEGIRAINSTGLMGGFPDRTFRPIRNTTRAEVSAILYRLVAMR